MAKVVNLKDLAKELEGFSEAHIKQLKQATALGVAKSIPYLVEASPIDTGQYANSWSFTADEESVILGNFAPHAPMIEYGARPFKPPMGPLLAWAKRVLRDSSQPPNYSSEVWRLAKGTQKKIEKYGMKPRHIMQNELPHIIERIKQEYNKLG